MRFKSCFRGLTAPSLRSKLGYTLDQVTSKVFEIHEHPIGT